MANMTHKEKDELINQMKEEILDLRKQIKRESKSAVANSEFISLSCLQDPKTRLYYVYEVAFDPSSSSIVKKYTYDKAPHLADFKAKEILHEKLLPQEIKGE